MKRSYGYSIGAVILALGALSLSCAESTPPYSLAETGGEHWSGDLAQLSLAETGEEHWSGDLAQLSLAETGGEHWSGDLAQLSLAEGLLSEALPPFEQTGVAIRMQRDAAYLQLTATAVRQVTVFPYTLEAARATATVEALRFAQQVTVEAMQIAQGATATAAAWHTRGTVQAQAQAVTATVQAARARQAELALARAERLYPLETYGPWALAIGCAGMLFWALVRLVRVAEMRARVVKVGAHERELLLLEDRVVQPTRGHVPVINYREPEGSQPAKVSAEEQRATTARAQVVTLMQAAHAPPQSPPQGGGKSVSLLQGGGKAASLSQGGGFASPPSGGTEGGRRTSKPKLTPRQAHELMTRQLAHAHPDVYAPVRVVPAAHVRTWLDDVRPQAYRDALINDLE